MALYSEFRPENEEFYGISLCAGYAGLDLGLHIAEPGYRTICYVEREAHAAAAIVARMEDQALAPAPIWDNLQSFDGRAWRGKVHLVTAGYPCQPFSHAGHLRGADDPRHLWPEVARIVDEVGPDWVFCENVEGHLNLGLSDVCAQLQAMDYRCKAGLFAAAETGASHRRRRLFLLAHANGQRRRLSPQHCDSRYDVGAEEAGEPADHQRRPIFAEQCDQKLDDDMDELAGIGLPKLRGAEGIFAPDPDELQEWHRLLDVQPDVQPAVFRTDDGMAERLDRLRGVGNGVSSMAAAIAWAVLKTDFDRDLGLNQGWRSERKVTSA